MRPTVLLLFSLLFALPAPSPRTSAPRAYLGFDRNDYPGDAALAILRKSFSFTGYWLGPPPGENSNSWSCKRELLRSQGFGFALLFAGPTSGRLRDDRTLSSRSPKIRKPQLRPRAAKVSLQAPSFFWTLKRVAVCPARTSPT